MTLPTPDWGNVRQVEERCTTTTGQGETQGRAASLDLSQMGQRERERQTACLPRLHLFLAIIFLSNAFRPGTFIQSRKASSFEYDLFLVLVFREFICFSQLSSHQTLLNWATALQSLQTH